MFSRRDRRREAWSKEKGEAWELYLTSKRNQGLRALEKARGGGVGLGAQARRKQVMIFFFAETREGQGSGHTQREKSDAAGMRTRTVVRRCCNAVSISCGVF
jgi:hypothetical protein